MKTSQLIKDYNALVPEDKAIKQWKGSKEGLLARIEKAKAIYNKPANTDEPKKAKFPTVADIARTLGYNPKVARAKLRRAGLAPKDGRWASIDPKSDICKKINDVLKRK